MQALILEGVNQPIRLKEVPDPQPGAGEVLVQLKAAALNHRDVWIQKGQYAGLKFPVIPGSDGAGIVTKAGAGTDTTLLGKEVIINPGLFWGDNPRTHDRKTFRILGLPDDGTFAGFVKVPAAYVHPKPAHLPFEQAAALPLGGLTGYRALFTRAGLQSGEKVLITGVGGGVAQLVMQFAVAQGAEVYVTSGSDEKIARAVAMGASGGTNYKQSGWAEGLKAQAGAFDVIIDSAAGDGFVKLIDLAALGGRIVFYGGTKGVINGIVPGKVFWKQLSILSCTMGSEKDFADMLSFVTEKRIEPVVDKVFPLANGEVALRYMDSAGQFGKIVLEVAE
jgi:NADPH:quinone reductase-like Zn-dependent oxidoreductase